MRRQKFYVLSSTELASIPLASASLTCGFVAGLALQEGLLAIPLVALGSMWLAVIFATLRGEHRHAFTDDTD